MRIIFPHRSIIGAPVSGTVDTGYTNTWLTRGDPSHPVRTTGSLSLTVTPAASLSVDVIAVTHHNIHQAAAIALGGSLATTIVTAAPQSNGIPHNWYRLLVTPVTVSSIVLGISGNTDPIVVGELYAGLSYTFDGLKHWRGIDPGKPFAWEGEYGLFPPYDGGVEQPRRLTGEILCTAVEGPEFVAGELAQRNGSRPCLVIPEDTISDAWLALIHAEATSNGDVHILQLEIVEIPKVRWP